MLDLEKFVKDFTKDFVKIKPKFDTALMNNADDSLKKRMRAGLLNEGTRQWDYAEETKEIREDEGLQTGYVDLEFTGELRRSIKTLNKKGETVLGIEEITYLNQETTIDVADKLRDQYGENVLSISDEEANEAFDGAIQAVSAEVDKAIISALNKAIK